MLCTRSWKRRETPGESRGEEPAEVLGEERLAGRRVAGWAGEGDVAGPLPLEY